MDICVLVCGYGVRTSLAKVTELLFIHMSTRTNKYLYHVISAGNSITDKFHVTSCEQNKHATRVPPVLYVIELAGCDGI